MAKERLAGANGLHLPCTSAQSFHKLKTASGCEHSCPQHLPVTEEAAVQRLIKNENVKLVSTKLKLLKLAYVNKYFTGTLQVPTNSVWGLARGFSESCGCLSWGSKEAHPQLH